MTRCPIPQHDSNIVMFTIMKTLSPLASLACLAAAAITIQPLSPTGLKQTYPAGIPGDPVHFGKMPYGSYVAGKLVAAGVCCLACEPQGFNASIPSIFMVMLDGCAVDTSVPNAQRAGAKAVLLYSASGAADVLNVTEVFNVAIPTLVVGAAAYFSLTQAEDTYLNITFDIGPPQTPVPIGLAFSLVPRADQLLSSLITLLLTLDPSTAKYTHYYKITSCTNCSATWTQNNCLFNGKYCADSDLLGTQMLQEAIRQTCAYQLSLQSNSYASYVEYLTTWFAQCSSPLQSPCYPAIAANTALLEGCYNASFVVNDNTILQRLKRDFEGWPGLVTPAALVGSEVLYGEVTFKSWERAICAKESLQLPMCSKYHCAGGCWPDMLANGVCDVSCNVTACHYDEGDCTNPFVFPASTSPSVPNATDPAPAPVTWCSPGCDLAALASKSCQTACNVSACNYQNWTCACAVNCPPFLLSNSICDTACNSSACDYDSSACLDVFSTREVLPSAHEESSDGLEAWRKWVVIACGSFGMWYCAYSVLCCLVLLVTFCFVRVCIKRRTGHVSVQVPQSSLLGLVPESSAFALNLGKFEEVVCIVCLCE